ncbi:MAG: hypothetical protein ACXVX7_02885 [Mycobacterium sp.]
MRLLAGPIVRRVEPTLVAIWVATDTACTVGLDIYNDAQSASSLPAADYHATAATIRAGEKLHFGLAVLDLATDQTALEPETVYYYNLSFTPAGGGGTDTLQSLNLLKDSTDPAKPHLALGYGTDALPSFVLPPRQLKDLKILHGSCRRVQYKEHDAMPWIDDFLVDTHTDAVKRPHQLFLTGDQIYADNLPTTMQHFLTGKANEYMGVAEMLPIRFPLDPGDFAQSAQQLECTTDNFPAGLRKNAIMCEARMTTSDGKNHLLSFGEFCVMYLMVWCNELWPSPDQLPDAPTAYQQNPTNLPEIWALHLGLMGSFTDKQPSPDIHCPITSDGKASPLPCTQANAKKVMQFFTTNKPEPSRKVKEIYDTFDSYIDDVKYTKDFFASLPKVRRALANIATYTIFDDHEISDDWNFAQPWKDRVLTSQLGRVILRNGLLAYTLCQGWGNDPRQFTADIRDPQGNLHAGPQKQILNAAPLLFPPGETATPVDDVAKQLDGLLGLDRDPATPPQIPQVPPPATWTYRIGGPHHLVLCLDVRTRRFQAGRTAAPQNLSADAVKEQLPTDTDPMLMNLPSDIDVVVVISSLVVLGPPVFDALLGPFSYKAFDIKDHMDRADLPATNPDAIESWPNEPIGFERLLNALAPLKRVVMLSGDVHYSTSVVMSYWTDRTKPPARFAQFVCSALKNDFFDIAAMASQSLALFQRVLQLDADIARIGWNNFHSDQLASPPGSDLLSLPSQARVAPALVARLDETPVMVPTVGWPAGTNEKIVNRPDWAWRTHILLDERPRAERPAALQSAQLYPDDLAHDATPSADAYPTIAARHAKSLNKMDFTRQILFAPNVGWIQFEKNDGVVTAIHRLYSTPPGDQLADPGALPSGTPQICMEHRVDLDTPTEQPPFIGTPVSS